jgi:hypothetical protein
VTAGRPSRWRLLALLPIAATGIWSLLASSTFEDDDEQQDRPAVVDWRLGSLAAPLVRDRGDRTETITNLRLAGSYEATAGDDLTLDRRVTIDDTSGFDLELIADDPDDGLSGTLEMEVLAGIDFDLAGDDPTTGQYSILVDGTTTLVTVQTNPDGVSVQSGGGNAVHYDWGDFRDKENDQDAGRALRLASSAFNTIEHVVQLARVVETMMDETEQNREILEDMGLDEPLELDCDNLATDDAGESVLLWRTDAAGSGQGDIGNGDSLEARFENCRNAGVAIYREGTIVIAEYHPARGDPPRTRAGEIDFGTLFFAEDQVTITTVPEPASPRIDGGLDLLYEETVTAPTEP